MLKSIKIDPGLAKALAKQKRQQAKEAFETKPVVEKQTNLPTAVIVDVDGTLAIRGNRGIFEFEKCEEDLVCEEVKTIVELLRTRPYINIIILSGREEVYKGRTEAWLQKNTIPYDGIIMRPTGDRRQDSIVKQELYERHLKGKFNILFVIDDRPRVIRTFRSLGLYVFDCNQTGQEF